MENSFRRQWFWAGLVLLTGVSARFFLASCGNNYDVESYGIVAKIAAHGGNVYAQTDRYNYGPVWFNILHLLHFFSGDNLNVLHCWVAGVLTLSDIGIAWSLWRAFGKLAACLFFLNPLSILITGYHSQMDNLAIFIGICAVRLYGDDFETSFNRKKLGGLLLLGLSLMTKHVLFAFPFWLALKQKGLWQKCLVMAVPVLCFLLGFFPYYWSGGGPGIMHNVFQYRSQQTHFFYNYFVPQFFQWMIGSQGVWMLALAVFAFVCRERRGLESLLIYTAVLVATSPAVANQYLAIPAAFTAVFFNPITICYIVIASFHLLTDAGGPGFLKGNGPLWDVAVEILFFAVVFATWRRQFVALLQKIVDEVKAQLKP